MSTRMYYNDGTPGVITSLPFPDEGAGGGGGTPAPDSTTPDPKGDSPDADDDSGDGDDSGPADAEGWKRKARIWEKRAQDDARKAKVLERDLHELKKSQMSDGEKAVAEARAEGEKAGLARASSLLVKARLEAALAHLNDDARDALIEATDVSRFLGEDYTPDAKAIKAWANRVAPRDTAGNGTGSAFPDLGSGRRKNHAPTDMNSLIRAAANRH